MAPSVPKRANYIRGRIRKVPFGGRYGPANPFTDLPMKCGPSIETRIIRLRNKLRWGRGGKYSLKR